jgi:UBX domain-containing protein 1
VTLFNPTQTVADLVRRGSLVTLFNPTQTVADLRHFVTLAQPAALKGREFVLMTTFPNRVLEDESLSLEDAKLCNADVVQKWK